MQSPLANRCIINRKSRKNHPRGYGSSHKQIFRRNIRSRHYECTHYRLVRNLQGILSSTPPSVPNRPLSSVIGRYRRKKRLHCRHRKSRKPRRHGRSPPLSHCRLLNRSHCGREAHRHRRCPRCPCPLYLPPASLRGPRFWHHHYGRGRNRTKRRN